MWCASLFLLARRSKSCERTAQLRGVRNKGTAQTRAKPLFFEQVGAESFRALERLGHLPFVDLRVVAREEHVGHFPTFVVGRTGVDGSCQQVVLEGIAECALFVADGTGNDAHDGIGHAGSGQFATGEHEIADRNLLCDEVLANAVVNALVVSAENNEVALHREAVGHGLVELFTIGRGENHFVIVAFGLERCDAVVDGLTLHYHSCKAAVGIVVDAAMFVSSIVTQVVHMNFDQSFFLRSCQDGGVEEAVEHFGNYGDDVDAHADKVVLVVIVVR